MTRTWPAAALSVLVACGLSGCNSILGIESASLEPADAGSTMMTADGGDAGLVIPAANYAVNCDNYCNLMTAGCPANAALFNTEYKTPAVCATICKTYWEPSPVVLNAAEEPTPLADTLACRVWHANAVLEGYPNNDPHTHCAHAGPLGGNHCDPGGTDYCVPFCTLDVAICNGENAQYAGGAGAATADQMSACLSACEPNPDAGYPGYVYWIDPTAKVTTDLVPTGNSVNCRMYHLENAIDSMSDPATFAFHCTHTGITGGGAGFCVGPIDGGM
jgi:hypothetical protein